jgi:hypothetical protein
VHVRYTTQPRVALLETIVVLFAFAAGAAGVTPTLPTFFRLAVPSLAVGIALLFRNGSGYSKQRADHAPLVDVALSFAAAMASQAILALLKPDLLLLPNYRFTRGALIAWGFLVVLRAWFPHRFKASRDIEAQVPLTMEQLRWKVMEFEIKARQWNHRGNLGAAAAIGLFASSLPFADSSGARLASGIFIAGAAYAAWIIRKRGAPAAAPLGGGWKDHADYYRAELQQQSTLLNRAWHCYFGALIPGALLLLQGSTLYAHFALIYVLLIGELNYRAIEWLHLQLARLHRPEQSQPENLTDAAEVQEG